MEPGVTSAVRANQLHQRPTMASSAPPGAVSVELRREVNLRPAEQATVEVLSRQRPNLAAFLSKAWLSGFVAGMQAGHEPLLALVRESGAIRAIAPLVLRRTLTHVRVSLLGGGHGSDRVDLLAARGFEARAADALLARLGNLCGRRALVFELRDVPSDSPLWGAV